MNTRSMRSNAAACTRRPGLWLMALVLAGCAGFIDKPERGTLYDLGPGPAPARAEAAANASATAVVLADIEAAGALEGTAVLYRLDYANGQQLRGYTQARWSAPPAQLVRRRLGEQLSRERVVLNPGEAALLSRADGVQALVLRLELLEFAQRFDSAAQSRGQVRLRATLLQASGFGEQLVGQRLIDVSRPATTPDAAGGARALAAAVDGATQEIAQWLRATPAH